MSRDQAKHFSSIMNQPIKYKNVPPKEIQNAIWGACFDYEDFDTVINGMTVRDRIYECWQTMHHTIKESPAGFVDFVMINQPDIEV